MTRSLLPLALALASCATSVRAPRGPLIVSEAGPEAATVLPQLHRLFLLTVHHYKQQTGAEVRASDLWEKIAYVGIMKGEVPCPGDVEDRCSGRAGFQGVRYFVEFESGSCLPLTSLVHEYLHVLSHFSFGDWDVNHLRRRIMCSGPVCDWDSVQLRVQAAGIADGLCD